MRTMCGAIMAVAVAVAVSLDAIGGPRDQYICYRSGSPYCDYPVIWIAHAPPREGGKSAAPPDGDVSERGDSVRLLRR